MIKRRLVLNKKYSFFLLGPRLTGKSTLLRNLIENPLLKIDLLRSQNYQKYLLSPQLLRNEVELALKTNEISNPWIVIDEIQKVPALLDEIHSMMEELNVHFALTGSSARKLKKSGANLLAGRAIEYRLYPFQFEEVENLFQLETVLYFGLLPKIFLEPLPEIKSKILKAYTSLYLNEEILQERVVRKIAPFTKFLEHAAESNAQELSFSNIAKEVGIGAKTIREYYDILSETLIGFYLYPWAHTVRKQLAGHPKFYFFDTGVTNALCGRMNVHLEKQTLGFLFETWLMNEIKTHLSYEELPFEMNYWKTKSDTEVDLLLSARNKIHLAIEFKYKSKIDHKDFSGLQSFHEDHPHTKRILVCNVDTAREENGIEVLPYAYFLKNIRNYIKLI